MTELITEQNVVNLFIEKHKNDGYIYIEEVPVFCRSVDVVKLSPEMRTMTAIEFKTTNWQRAIEQVLDVALVFDFLEIALLPPKRECTKQAIMDECYKYGLGLYFVDIDKGKIIHALKPKSNQELWKTHRAVIKNYISARLNNG